MKMQRVQKRPDVAPVQATEAVTILDGVTEVLRQRDASIGSYLEVSVAIASMALLRLPLDARREALWAVIESLHEDAGVPHSRALNDEQSVAH